VVFLPLSSEAFPKGGGAFMADCHDPAVSKTLDFGACAHVGIQSEPQQQAAQENSVVLAIL